MSEIQKTKEVKRIIRKDLAVFEFEGKLNYLIKNIEFSKTTFNIIPRKDWETITQIALKTVLKTVEAQVDDEYNVFCNISNGKLKVSISEKEKGD